MNMEKAEYLSCGTRHLIPGIIIHQQGIFMVLSIIMKILSGCFLIHKIKCLLMYPDMGPLWRDWHQEMAKNRMKYIEEWHIKAV